MNFWIRVILSRVLEAIYFSLFLIKGKNIKNKRILFVCIMIFEYMLLSNVLEYNILFQIFYTFMSFVNLKVLYKEKAQITDIFLFMAASIILMIISILCGMVQFLFNINHFTLLIINRIILFFILWILRNKLHNIYVKFYKTWNRHNDKHKIRSLTLRNISIIIFNLMFYVINICMIYANFIIK